MASPLHLCGGPDDRVRTARATVDDGDLPRYPRSDRARGYPGQSTRELVTHFAFLSVHRLCRITVTSQSRVPGSTFGHLPALVLIPCVALFSSLLIGVSIAGGILAMRDLHRAFAARSDARAAEGWLLLHGSRGVRGLGLVTPVLLPLLFASVWLFLLIRAAHETLGAR